VALVGNVHTVVELLQGTPESVSAAAQRCIDAAGAGGRFLLGSGCIVPRYSLLENVRAIIVAVQRSGNSVPISEKGKPIVKIVPISSAEPSWLGCMKDNLFQEGVG
jgi:hypothetical protein